LAKEGPRHPRSGRKRAPGRLAGYVVNGFIVILIILNAIAFAAETVDQFWAFNLFSVAVFAIEYALRVWSAVEIPMLSHLLPWRARLRFAKRPIMIIDLLAFAPWYLHWLVPVDLRVLRVFRLFRLLKLVRYSPALQTLGRVLADEYRALLGTLLVMLVLLPFASTAICFLEHGCPRAALRHQGRDGGGGDHQAALRAKFHVGRAHGAGGGPGTACA
jgi:voltage-gated potassium channel